MHVIVKVTAKQSHYIDITVFMALRVQANGPGRRAGASNMTIITNLNQFWFHEET